MGKGWLAAFAVAAFAAVWYLTRGQPDQSASTTVSAVPARGPMPTVPNSAANGNVVATGKGASGSDVESLVVGGAIAGGLTAVGVPLPASVLAAKILAVPTTYVINNTAGRALGFVGDTPFVYHDTIVDASNPQFIADPRDASRAGGRAAPLPQIPNPNYVRYPKTYPGLKLAGVTHSGRGSAASTEYDYIVDPKAAVITGAPPVLP